METPVRVMVDGEVFEGVISDDAHPAVADAMRTRLPLEGRPMRWGREYYFPVDADVAVDDGRTEVSVGDLAYWPEGGAVCLFFGPTPASDGDTPVAASPVAVFGRVDGVERLRGKGDVSEMQVERRH